MGYDVSVYAVDPALFADTLVPAVLGEPAPALGAFLDRAARLGAVAARANAWGLRVVALDREIEERQFDVGPERVLRRPRRFGVLRGLLGGTAYDEVRVTPRASGIPGFDADLCVWGRPFFVVGDTTDDVLDGVERYLACADPEADLEAADAVARSMIDRLDDGHARLPPDLAPEVVDVVGTFRPFLDHLPEAGADRTLDVADVRRDLAGQVDLLRDAWRRRHTDDRLGDDRLPEAVPASDLTRDLPLALVGLGACVLPGWMGRGYVWPTTLLPESGVRVSDLFETPAGLFGPLVQAHPALGERLCATIGDHGRLGGYVRPERVSELRARIEAHEAEIVAAFGGDDFGGAADPAAVYKKLIEPVAFAERHGCGVLEAEGVYSGVMGMIS